MVQRFSKVGLIKDPVNEIYTAVINTRRCRPSMYSSVCVNNVAKAVKVSCSDDKFAMSIARRICIERGANLRGIPPQPRTMLSTAVCAELP